MVWGLPSLKLDSKGPPRPPGTQIGTTLKANVYTQGTQYTLIKENTLNYRGLNILISKVYSLIKGYWVLWVLLRYMDP